MKLLMMALWGGLLASCASTRDRSSNPASSSAASANSVLVTPRILNAFGETEYKRSPWMPPDMPHPGTDFLAPEGSEVVAVSSGLVLDVQRIDYGDDHFQINVWNTEEVNDDGVLLILYAHVRDLRVGRGSHIETGDVLGYVWGGPYDGWAPHVHLQFCTDGGCDPSATVDPMESPFTCLSRWRPETRGFVYPVRC